MPEWQRRCSMGKMVVAGMERHLVGVTIAVLQCLL